MYRFQGRVFASKNGLKSVLCIKICKDQELRAGPRTWRDMFKLCGKIDASLLARESFTALTTSKSTSHGRIKKKTFLSSWTSRTSVVIKIHRQKVDVENVDGQNVER